MKMLLLLPLLLVFLLTSCDKDHSPQPADTTVEVIKGKWTCTSITRRYYDESEQLIHQETEDLGWFYDFDGKHYRIIIPSSVNEKPASFKEAFVEEYVIVNESGRDYLYHVYDGNKTIQIEITGISNSRMTWTQHVGSLPFNDGTREITADSAIQIFKFVRRQ